MGLHIANEILKCFGPVSLNEMDGVELMDRTDIKYVFSSASLQELLRKASSHYRILEIDQLRSFHYRTTYFDTDDFRFFRHHMSGKLNRYKLRYRIYESTGASFLEIKFKSNKLRTTKWRINNHYNKGYFDDHAKDFIGKYLKGNINLKPVLVNKFERITLVGIELKERITIDFNLSFATMENREIHLPYLCVAEIKCESFRHTSPFVSILKEMNIRQSGFSKYCIGNILLKNVPGGNAFKSKILTLQKLEDDYILYTTAG